MFYYVVTMALMEALSALLGLPGTVTFLCVTYAQCVCVCVLFNICINFRGGGWGQDLIEITI